MLGGYKTCSETNSSVKLRAVDDRKLTRESTVIKDPPFRIAEEGWGEFFMDMVFTAPDKDHTISHDLNFQKNRYEATHTLVSDFLIFETSAVEVNLKLISPF